jgi:hypothetical protein
MVTTKNAGQPINIAAKRVQKAKDPRKTEGPCGGNPQRRAQISGLVVRPYFEYGLENQGTFSIYKLVGWLRGRGLLAQGETAPHVKTLERWSSKEKWVERRAKDLSALADRAELQLREGLSFRKAGRYRQLEKHVQDLSQHLELYMNVCEVFDEETGKWVERPNPYETEIRPTRIRPRLPSEFGRGSRANLYTQANMERVVSSLDKAMAALDRLLPQKIAEPESEEDDDRLVLKIVSKDQIAELGAKFGALVEQLREKTEERRIERGLDAFGEPLINQDPDAPGRDMLELDEELGPNEEWVYETIEVDDPGQLPPGVYMNEAGEILPINGPHPDDEGEWDSDGD